MFEPTTKYNLPSLMPLGEKVDVERLRKAINSFAEVHSGIFTIIKKDDEGIVGGLGISIMKSISADTEYAYSNNKNILIIKF